MKTLMEWKVVEDVEMDVAFMSWCFNGGVDPMSAKFSAKVWDALFQGFLNDWLDVNVNGRNVSPLAIEKKIEPELHTPTRPTMDAMHKE
jgi:hypothetical protein